MYTCTVGPVSECAARTIYCAVAVADVADEKNAVSFLCEASGGPSSFLRDFFMPLLLALLLICVVPGLRPAPGRHPPLQPFLPTMSAVGPKRSRLPTIQKKPMVDLHVQSARVIPCDAHLKMEHDGTFWLEIR